MIDFPGLADLCITTPSKIVMLVVDGLGGAPQPETGRSELEVARLPNLDRLARESTCGRTVPVLPGITPGSGPGHLALFGYDPLKYFIGRGVLEALGIEAPILDGDVAARGNFCTVDASGLLTDRRAGAHPDRGEPPPVRVSGCHPGARCGDHRASRAGLPVCSADAWQWPERPDKRDRPPAHGGGASLHNRPG